MVRRTGSPIEVLADDAVTGLRLRTPRPGVVLGEDQRGGYVSLTLFRSVPTRVLVIGQPRLTKLVAVRALAVGAALSLRSTQPAGWEQVLRCAEELDRGGPGTRPRLTIADNLAGERGGTADPWSTWLDSRLAVGERDRELVTSADLVLAARTTPAQGAWLAGLVGITGAAADLLATMPAGCVAVVGHGQVLPVRVSPTPTELTVIS